MPVNYVNAWMGHSGQVGDAHYTILGDSIFDLVTNVSTDVSTVTVQSAVAGSDIGFKLKSTDELQAVEDSRDTYEKTRPEINSVAGSEGVVRAGIEPATHGFSVPPSKNEKSAKNPGKTSRFDDSESTENSPCQQNAGCFSTATINPKKSLISAILYQLDELDLPQLKTVHDMITLIHADVLKTKVS